MRLERWLYTIPLRLRTLFSRRQVERELDDELRFHVERQTEQNIAGGMSPAHARTAALRAFGGIERHKEDARDARGVRIVEQLARDLAYSLRLARKQPGFSSIGVLSLALGLGATTAVFNLTYNALFARLQLPHPEQLVALQRVAENERDNVFTWSEYLTLRETSGIGTLAATRGASAISITAGDVREFINIDFVGGEFFPILGMQPLQGRLLTPADDSGRASVVVISARFGERLFPGVPSPLGRTVLIRGAAFAVVGVTPASFRGLDFPGSFTAAIPMSTVPLLAQDGSGRDSRGIAFSLESDGRGEPRAFGIVGRLAPDGPADRAALELAFARCCATSRTDAREKLAVIDISRGIPGSKNDFRAEARTILTILLAGMGLVLFVVCCNIASLLLVRASARQREIAVRLSLGASRSRLVGQLVLENVPLAFLGGVAAFFVASASTSALVASLPADWDTVSDVFHFHAGLPVILFTAVITVACGIAFTVYPALRATRQPVGQTLRVNAHASRSRSQGVVARGAVVAQVAATVVLVTAASLLAASLANLSRVNGGFAVDNVLLTSVEARSTQYERAGVGPLYAEILRHVEQVPGVRAAAMSTWVPLFGGNSGWLSVEVPGYSEPSGDTSWVRMSAVTPGFLSAAGVRLTSGRDFAPADGPGAEPVVIASAAFARRYFGERDPIGHSIRADVGSDSPITARIVGVAADVSYEDLRSAPGPLVYFHVAQTRETLRGMQLLLRTVGEPLNVAPAVMRAIDAATPGIQVRRMRDMRSQREVAMTVERLAAQLAAFVSAMALVLSAVGLFGVVAYAVARRTSELGIRIALGARSVAIIWLVVSQTFVFVGLGVLLGLPLSFAANSAMASQLFGVGAHDPMLSAASVLVLSAVALLASVVPARRAIRIDPRTALSAE